MRLSVLMAFVKSFPADVPDMKGLELLEVSTKEPLLDVNSNHRIAVLDLGIKRNILRNLAKRDCYEIFPFDATYNDLLSFSPDGFSLSNGPGDPEPLLELFR
jgi:carbamoyl-phosphate synthase small subunit